MELEEFKKRLNELRDIIVEGIAYLSAWYEIANLNEDEAHALNRYRGFFLPVQLSLKQMALLQFAKVFDKDLRTSSLRSLIDALKDNPNLLTPHAEEQDLQQLENKIDEYEELLSHLKIYRDQRLAHHDSTISGDTSLTYGQIKQLVDDVKNMYNTLSRGHERSITSFDSISVRAGKDASQVKRIMGEKRVRARGKYTNSP